MYIETNHFYLQNSLFFRFLVGKSESPGEDKKKDQHVPQVSLFLSFVSIIEH